ncbi:hypothetical protein FYK55_17110 [Roseiconus nitratireducens]|uniref:Uncharacterized protein n=1 Tax=Roseiconus nitratireducens TaxID=2605748 RepID=A0A5M6D9P2_9BACT|nr:hypothetical protein [Roseiconus nitratireducens]KAA5541915.1 hypothetical protein FYK55_17110 [Roseiconus nitratireducens]
MYKIENQPRRPGDRQRSPKPRTTVFLRVKLNQMVIHDLPPPEADAKHWYYKRAWPRLFRLRKTAHRRSEVWRRRFHDTASESFAAFFGGFSLLTLRSEFHLLLRIAFALFAPIVFAIAIVYGIIALMYAGALAAHYATATIVDAHYFRFDPVQYNGGEPWHEPKTRSQGF